MIKILYSLIVLFLLTGCQAQSVENQTNADYSVKPVVYTPLLAKTKAQNQAQSKSQQKSRYKVEHDGEPKKKPLVFKEPKPVKEALSRYGNPATYSTNGRTYAVMRSSAGYKARGIASWYGTKFHKQRTSSGDIYDMYAMTAAHKTLPLPSYVKVKNLDNGRTAVVKVNDRGPFHANRVIDLSYAAAVKLGLLPKGTARVEIEVLKGIDNKSRYYLQAGAFVSEHSAKQLKDKIGKFMSSPVFIEKYNGNYIVRIGPFANKKMADTQKMKLTSKGIYGAFSVLG